MDSVAWQAFASIRRRRGVQRPGRRAPAVATLAGFTVLLAACGGGGADAAHSSTTTSPRSTTSASTTGRSSEAAAVLSAYRAAWHAFEHALADANPSDPLLTATMVDPQLQGVKANLLADQRQGIVGRGPTTLHPKVTALSSTTATVLDCVHSATELIYQSTGKPVPPVTPPENDGVTATMVLTSGTWKLEKQTVTDGKCAAGS
jgi:hypothetical protein